MAARHVEQGGGADGGRIRRARLAVDQRDLAEEFARVQDVQGDFPAVGIAREDAHLPLENAVEAVAVIALGEDDFVVRETPRGREGDQVVQHVLRHVAQQEMPRQQGASLRAIVFVHDSPGPWLALGLGIGILKPETFRAKS